MSALATIQPYLWFVGMIFFSASYHIAGIRGLPRRVYSAALAGDQGAAWHGLTIMAAIGGAILFLSAMTFVTVVVATWVTGRRIEPPPFEFALPLQPAVSSGVWDRLGMWTVVATVLILLAYAYPLIQLLSHPRFGSPAFQPF
jgi:cytochrome c oxidase subunit 1